jgi:hypothetical protein
MKLAELSVYATHMIVRDLRHSVQRMCLGDGKISGALSLIQATAVFT